MKITKEQLKKIIKEEMAEAIDMGKMTKNPARAMGTVMANTTSPVIISTDGWVQLNLKFENGEEAHYTVRMDEDDLAEVQEIISGG
tara:strand:- start:159 stop:416 length:258 start_codon:yes stop_codon:yes gene_type:complete